MKTKSLLLTVGVSVLSLAMASAQLYTITDATLGTSTRDGTINAGEYGSLSYFSPGTNTGFGNALFGSSSKLYWDSSTAGALNFGIQLGGGNLNDAGVIYIDSVSGGLTDTTTIEDTSDPGRSAISGDGGGFQSELTFASAFAADYAIAIENGGANLFQIGGDGSLTFLKSMSLTPTGTATDQQREGELLLGDIGLGLGDSFKYYGTYLNSGNAFRANELNGDTYNGGNIGQSPFTAGNYNLFTAIPEPSSATVLGLALLAGAAWLRRRR